MTIRLHLLGLPHTEWDETAVACAYTSKNVKLVKALTMRGIEVITYGGRSPCAHATEHVFVRDVPPIDHGLLYELDWINDFKEYNKAVIPLVRERMQDKDFLGCSSGCSHQEVAEAIPELMAVETGIGYFGTFAKYRVFESFAWQHTVYGDQKDTNGHFYDCVIPNLFDVDDFAEVGTHPVGDHLAWMGRFVERKGPHVAYQIAQATNRHLMMAGQGVLASEKTAEGTKLTAAELTMEGEGFTHVGPVNKAQRARFLSSAHALVVPTIYIGPFEGVAVEALLSGTPTITTNWGAFTEYVIPHWNGTRFHTLREAVEGVEEATFLDRKWIQAAARKRFSLEAVGEQYERYFERLLDLWGDGWSTL